MSTANESVFREVLAACSLSVEAAQASVRKNFTEDCRWQQSGFPTTTGPEEAAALLGSLADSIGMVRIDVEYRHVACTDDVVFTERLDWLVQADGTRLGPGVVVSIAKFRDGKISSWSEYFETSGFEQNLST
ncbi:MAG: limonene,2-epoxide hydrolase [Frankiales bacterium]|nr:limonene,2-epoxide hydrolase [Frankiales bacterium]